MIKLSSMFILIFLLSSCATPNQNLKAYTSGKTGCQPSEIVLKDVAGWLKPLTWTAECRGKTYYCSSAGNQFSCSEAK